MGNGELILLLNLWGTNCVAHDGALICHPIPNTQAHTVLEDMAQRQECARLPKGVYSCAVRSEVS